LEKHKCFYLFIWASIYASHELFDGQGSFLVGEKILLTTQNESGLLRNRVQTRHKNLIGEALSHSQYMYLSHYINI